MFSRISIPAVLLAAALSLAQEPTTQPDSATPTPAPTSDQPNQPPMIGGQMGGGQFGRRPYMQRFIDRFGGGGPRGMPDRPLADLSREDPPTNEEWERITEFSRENFPNRWQMFERVRDSRGEDSPLVAALKLRIANRYRMLIRAQSELPGFYQAALDQGKLEDSAWGLAQQVQREPDNTALRDQLRGSVEQLIKGVLAERGERIKRMREALDTEQQAYDHDSHNIDMMVDWKMSRLTGDPTEFERGAARRAAADGSTTEPSTTSDTTQPTAVPAIEPAIVDPTK